MSSFSLEKSSRTPRFVYPLIELMLLFIGGLVTIMDDFPKWTNGGQTKPVTELIATPTLSVSTTAIPFVETIEGALEATINSKSEPTLEQVPNTLPEETSAPSPTITFLPPDAACLIRLTFGTYLFYIPTTWPAQSRLLASAEIDDRWQLVTIDPFGSGMLGPFTPMGANFHGPMFFLTEGNCW